jgi:choline dehydrogenase
VSLLRGRPSPRAPNARPVKTSASAGKTEPRPTAKIGTGAEAVVDSELLVHGLRVADASVMPSIISGPTNAPAFMTGGRAAELIRAAT